MIQLRKLIAFAFWELRRILNAIAGDAWLDFRAMALLVCTQIGFVLSLLGTVSILTRRSLLPPQGLASTFFNLFLAATVSVVNYYGIQYKDRWKRFESEFNAYSKSRKAVGGLVIMVLPILAIVSAVWVASKMAQLSL